MESSAFPEWRSVLRVRSCPAWSLPIAASQSILSRPAGRLILTRHRSARSPRLAARWHGSGEPSARAPALSHSGAAAGHARPNASRDAAAPMNVQPTYTLVSQPQTSRVLARLGVAVARHLRHRHLPDRRRADRGDVVPHRHRLLPLRLRRHRRDLALRPGRAVGGQHLHHLQRVPRRIPAAEFLRVQAACPAHHPALERHADLPFDARLSGAGQRRLFARLDRAVLLSRRSAVLVVSRFAIVRVTALARAAGLFRRSASA